MTLLGINLKSTFHLYFTLNNCFSGSGSIFHLPDISAGVSLSQGGVWQLRQAWENMKHENSRLTLNWPESKKNRSIIKQNYNQKSVGCFCFLLFPWMLFSHLNCPYQLDLCIIYIDDWLTDRVMVLNSKLYRPNFRTHIITDNTVILFNCFFLQFSLQ